MSDNAFVVPSPKKEIPVPPPTNLVHVEEKSIGNTNEKKEEQVPQKIPVTGTTASTTFSKPKERNAFIRWIETLGVGREKEYIIENLSILLSSGSDILSAISSIRMEIKSKVLQRILTDLEKDVASGMLLSEALNRSGIVPKHVNTLIAIGESSGKMQDNLRVVVTQQAKDRMFFSKIRSAMIYPGLVFGLMIVVGTGVGWFILPRIANIFSQLKIDLPFVTRVIIKLGEFLSNYGAIFVPAVFIVVSLSVFFLFFYSKTKWVGQNFLFHIPGIRELIQELELAHIGFILGTLLNAGVPIVLALDALSGTAGFYKYRALYKHLRDRIEKGDQFSDSFKTFPKLQELVPNPVQQIIVAGEQSGNLEGSFKKIGDIYEQKTEITTKNISILLEPILLVIVWIAVVMVALGVILPIYSLIGGLNK